MSPTDPTNAPAGDVWTHQARIARQLGAWAAGSILAGGALAVAGQASGSRALRAFGGQTAAWGAIDLGIATYGELRRRGRQATAEEPFAPETLESERRQLRRVLLVNAGLDVGFIAIGAAGVAVDLRRSAGADRLPAVVGHSAAVISQGLFLLAFDLGHARGLREQAG